MEFQEGDTVWIVGDVYTHQFGEVVTIDEEATAEGDFYGVYLEDVDSIVYFRADELEKS